MSTIEQARQEIAKLIAKYERLSPTEVKRYNEANTCKDFLLPLFKVLGWDVDNASEVSAEEKVSRGRVDYAFRLRGIPRFFLEAKPLRADLHNPEYAKQVINYAYHKGVTWAVLTDFEGLKVFNAEWKGTDIARSPRLELSYQQYLERFDRLWLLSRESFEQGLLDKEAEGWGIKLKKTPVGQQLFSDLVAWRGLLHRHLSLYNKDKPSYLIDEAVQRILDRLIFIRTCEDRGIEPPTLRPLVREWRNGAGKGLVPELRQIWRDFESGYDSRLFVHHLADELDCDPTPFADVIEGLYATKDGSIEYDFNAIDADVLGGIYEQYLEHLLRRAGEEIEITAERRKRKAQGIYYTPKFVVRYIVENTLGPALNGKSLQQARKIRILDPACGSGSFLVEALDYLGKHWQKEKWTQQPKPGEGAEQAHFFDYVTKVQFLTENLYGVDLDAQAVEIAQLNLLLRALSQRALLPDLVNNIRQGNSLISGTEEELRPYFGDAWQKKKPFNWQQEFDKAMQDGGFDVVIGNPPYGAEFDQHDKDYLCQNFETSEYQLDSYLLFMEKAVKLLKPAGLLGFIIPNPWLTNIKVGKLRRYILDNTKILGIVYYPGKVFGQSVVDTVVVILQKEEDCHKRRVNQVRLTRHTGYPSAELMYAVPQAQWENTGIFNIFLDASGLQLLRKIEQNTTNLKILCDVVVGLKPYQVGKGQPKQTRELVESRGFDATYKKDDAYRRYIRGSDINRYCTQWDDKHWISYGKWLAEPRKKENFDAANKIIIRQTGDSLIATLDQEQFVSLNNTHTINLKDVQYNLRYILALLNSSLMNYYYQGLNPEKGEALAEVKATNVKNLPIRRIDFDNPVEKKMRDDLVALVDSMLELNKRLAPIRTTPCSERDELLREIERTDHEIDNLVYDLYGLTEEERRLVEGEQQRS